MSKVTRRGSLVLGAAALALGAWQPAAAQDKGTIYYMIPTLLDEFQTETQKAIEGVFGDMGYEVISLDAQNRADLQLNQLEDVIQLQPDAIIMNAVDFDAIVPGIEQARAAGIPVLNYDRQIRSAAFELTSVAGTVEIGQIAAGEAIRLLSERHGSPRGKVLQILGDPGDNYTLDIQKGFEERMAAEAADVEIITNAAMQWEAENAGTILEDQLLVNPDIDLIFAARRAPHRAAGRNSRGGGQAARRHHDDGFERGAGRPRQHPERLAAGRGRATALCPGLRARDVCAHDPCGQDARARDVRRGRAAVGADHRGVGPEPQDPGRGDHARERR